jgi:DNA-binding MarR family transcriptional regulator
MEREPDWIDQIVDRWSALRPGLPVAAYHVTGRIARIAARIAQREEEIFGRFGLTRADVGVLGALYTSPPPHTLSPTQLFRGLMLSSAGMTKRLDLLEHRGLVQRKPDPRDRRAVGVHLTESGRRLITKAVAENTQNEAALLAGLNRQQQRLLADLLRSLLGKLEPPAGD